MTDRDREDALEALDARLPTVACKGLCHSYCEASGATQTEWERMQRAVGVAPEVGPGEPLVCPLLTADGRCSAYEVRPLICRTWGASENMRCPWGCEPDPRALSRMELGAVQQELRELDGPLLPMLPADDPRFAVWKGEAVELARQDQGRLISTATATRLRST